MIKFLIVSIGVGAHVSDDIVGFNLKCIVLVLVN